MHTVPALLHASLLANAVRVPFARLWGATPTLHPWPQVTAVARQAFRRAVLEASPRLVEAMFLCEVSAASEVLSGMCHGCICVI